ncbi:MAG: hypothetical protein R3D84_09330 [Paracoccaceae bacterium]
MLVIDLALPVLEAGQGLRFCILPEGQDPDDLIKAQGAGAMQKLLDQAMPMVALLWREPKAASLTAPNARPRSTRVCARYWPPSATPRSATTTRRKSRPCGGICSARDAGRKPATPHDVAATAPPAPVGPPPSALPATRESLLASASAETAVEETLREAVILATLIRHPALVERFLGQLETVELRGPEHDRLRAAILRHAGETDAAAFHDAILDGARGPLENLGGAPCPDRATRATPPMARWR